VKNFQAIFMITKEYCYRKNRVNFGLDPIHNGQITAILDFHCIALHDTEFR